MPATPVMVRVEKVATPPEIVAVEPAVMVPPVPELIVAVMVPEALTTLPPESSTLTTGWPVRAEPLAAPEGWVLMTNWVAAPVDIAMFDEAADVKPPPVKVRV